MREGALKASVAILVQANGLESKLSSYALKTVTLFAQNQFRKYDPDHTRLRHRVWQRCFAWLTNPIAQRPLDCKRPQPRPRRN